MAARLTGLERRNRIIDEASRLFAYKGLHGVTTREIAKAAGVTEPVLYQHFKSKDEIYKALQSMCSQQTAYFRSLIKETGSGTESLALITYLLVRVISFCREPGSKPNPKTVAPAEILLRLMGYSFLEDGRFARKLVENCIGAFFDEWLTGYKLAHREGSLEIEKPEAASLWMAYESLIGMGLFVLPADRLIPVKIGTDEMVRQSAAFLLRALGVKEKVLRSKIDWASLRKIYARAVSEQKQASGL